MQVMTITNPNTGREVRVKAWSVEPRKALELIQEARADGRNPIKVLSWTLLSGPETVAHMEETSGGEDARSNFALNILENALDWGLGLAVINFLQFCLKKYRAIPKPFKVAADRRGNVYIVTATGRVLVGF